MKIIGAGFGRTGTTSLKAALEELGFSPCYHMSRVITHPRHVKIWLYAAQNRQVNWKNFLRNYEATLDFPACLFYKELMTTYPDAKVLLSVRDPQKWYDSVYQTIYATTRIPRWLIRAFPPIQWFDEMAHAVVWDGLFHGQFEDRDYAISVFNQHLEEVKTVVSPKNLLVFNVKEGWRPLCEFLDVPIPNKSFPHLNDKVRIQKWIRFINRLNI
ncbi:MAG: sulfotransferase family protein [Promethearchaeota archaeon]